MPIRLLGRHVGDIYLAGKEDGGEFTQDDEETLVLFAAQAALAIANALRYREERRGREYLETLVNTSPVGVVVFDAATGSLSLVNREARRIVDGLRDPDQAAEQLLEVLSFRRADGREVSLSEFPLARALATGETVRAEEIVISVPDGRSLTTLINATPIASEEGAIETVVVTLQDLTPLEEIERQRAGFPGHGEPRAQGAPHLDQGLRRRPAARPVSPGPCRVPAVPAHHRRPGRPHTGPDRPVAGRGEG